MPRPESEIMKNSPFLRCTGGFTLLEILVAIFIFSIVMTTIFGSFNLVIGKANDIEKKTNHYEMGKNCLNRIVSDVRSLYLPLWPLYSPPDFNDDPDPYRFLGEKTAIDGIEFSKLQFVANAHLPLGGEIRSGTARIVYYVQKASDDQNVLKRSDNLFPVDTFEEDPNDPVVCENLTALSFFYYDTEGEEFEYWDSDSSEFGYASPSAIKIRIKIGNESDEIELETMALIAVVREKKKG